MTKFTVSTMFAASVLFSAIAAYADNAADVVQRDVNQEKRIDQGLRSGSLNTREAARLEGEEARVNRMEANAAKDGVITDREKARIERAQDKVSRDIYREKHDAQRGDPNSVSSKRMQADVQRNVNQQQRVEQGIQNGTLSNKEVGTLERGQARVDRKEARAGADGHVAAEEQEHIQAAENHQSRRIHKLKHNHRNSQEN
jgi:hypothetical protein